MKTIPRLFIVSLLILSCSNLFAQNILIRGKVRNANTHQEISQVNIYLEDLQLGTTSDAGGNFNITIPQKFKDYQIILEHVSYYPLKISIHDAQTQKNFDLNPRIIQLPKIQIEAQKDQAEILKDIPQPISIIESKEFDIRGYVDAGDLLKIDQSIQVKEAMTGKKTITLRGGNADDVVVLYNGIRLNNMFDNIFDLSLINLEDIKYFNVIKGSNSSLYGAEAVSGVINIVPKTYRNYKLRFQQKLGTYASGDWTIQLNENLYNHLNLSYSYKQGSTTRIFEDTLETNDTYVNKNTYHTATFEYDFTPDETSTKENKISMMYFHSNLDFDNNRLNETVNNLNQILTLRYSGDFLFLKKLNLITSYRTLEDQQITDFERMQIDKHFLNKTYNYNFENTFTLKELELLVAYQGENGELDYKDEIGSYFWHIESALLKRQKHGFISILKYHIPTGSNFYKITDIDISYRRDNVQNKYDNVNYQGIQNIDEIETPQLKSRNWNESLLNFSSHLEGRNEFFGINAYLTYGSNYKIPTMFQQVSIPETIGPNPVQTTPNLKPEKNNCTELGVDFMGEVPNDLNLTGWQFSANYFRNSYNNKLRTYYLPGIPIAFYDNVKYAEISGFESRGSLFLYQKKLTLEVGTAIYSISEKAAFPFKSDQKHIFNLLLEHAGFSFQFHYFKESDQIGWIRNLEGQLEEVSLEGYSNIDIHLNKTIDTFHTKLFVNFSGRNLLDDDTKFNGIAIRDRRFYFTFGAQY